jgi:hypothetical protein
MSNYYWTISNSPDDRIRMQHPLNRDINDVMKDVLDDARFGEVDSIVVEYTNGVVQSYNYYSREEK